MGFFDIVRKSSIEKILIQGKMEGKRRRGGLGSRIEVAGHGRSMHSNWRLIGKVGGNSRDSATRLERGKRGREREREREMRAPTAAQNATPW